MTVDSSRIESRSVSAPESQGSARSLKSLAIRGSVWTITGYGASQLLRLGSNLVLTRLLFPETFGLMVLVQIFMQGLGMFSDIGIRPSIIQNERGDDPAFLNTAWTIQVMRGFVLWVCACLLAWPVAAFYGESKLTWLIPVAGLTALIAGFNSTALATASRHLALGRLTVLELITQIVSILVMVTWAWFSPTVWALVAGGLVGSLVKMTSTHLWLANTGNHFAWDRRASKALFSFGRWIFFSTAITFLLQQGDKVVLGKMITGEQLGIYSIAVLLSRTVVHAMLSLNSQIMFPVYAELANERPEQLRNRVFRARSVLLLIFLPLVCGMAIAGEHIVAVLYDDRYLEAGWMLQILAAGAVGSIISVTAGAVLLAVGDSFRFMVVQIIRGSLLVVGMVVGGWVGGFKGLVIGVAASKVLDYPILAWSVSYHKLWMPKLDLPALGVCGAVIGLGWRLL